MIPVKVLEYAPSKPVFSAKFPDGETHRVTILAGTTLPRGFEKGAAAWIVPAQGAEGNCVTPAIDIPWAPQPPAVVPSNSPSTEPAALSAEVQAVLAEDPNSASDAAPEGDPDSPPPPELHDASAARQTPSLVAGENR